MTTYLSRDDILNVQDFRTDAVDVPEWGGIVLIRELSAPEMLRISLRVNVEKREEGKPKVDLAKFAESIPTLISWCVVDERGASILSIDDVNHLSAESTKPVNRILAKIMKLSNLTSPDKDESEDDGSEVKNE